MTQNTAKYFTAIPTSVASDEDIFKSADSVLNSWTGEIAPTIGFLKESLEILHHAYRTYANRQSNSNARMRDFYSDADVIGRTERLAESLEYALRNGLNTVNQISIVIEAYYDLYQMFRYITAALKQLPSADGRAVFSAEYQTVTKQILSLAKDISAWNERTPKSEWIVGLVWKDINAIEEYQRRRFNYRNDLMAAHGAHKLFELLEKYFFVTRGVGEPTQEEIQEETLSQKGKSTSIPTQENKVVPNIVEIVAVLDYRRQQLIVQLDYIKAKIKHSENLANDLRRLAATRMPMSDHAQKLMDDLKSFQDQNKVDQENMANMLQYTEIYWEIACKIANYAIIDSEAAVYPKVFKDSALFREVTNDGEVDPDPNAIIDVLVQEVIRFYNIAAAGPFTQEDTLVHIDDLTTWNRQGFRTLRGEDRIRSPRYGR